MSEKKQLNDGQLDVVKQFGMVKMLRFFTANMNKLCARCRVYMYRNPKKAYDILTECSKCKPIVEKAEKKFGLK